MYMIVRIEANRAELLSKIDSGGNTWRLVSKQSNTRPPILYPTLKDAKEALPLVMGRPLGGNAILGDMGISAGSRKYLIIPYFDPDVDSSAIHVFYVKEKEKTPLVKEESKEAKAGKFAAMYRGAREINLTELAQAIPNWS